MTLTPRRIKILEIVVDEYAANAIPVGSQLIHQKYLTEISPQTIRNELLILEDLGYLEKTHTSSGRVPTTMGYEFYRDHLTKPTIDVDIKNKLQSIFQKRMSNIDETINESVNLISKLLHMPVVVTTSNHNERLALIKLIDLEDDKALIMMVSSYGEVIKLIVPVLNKQQYNDICICIEILNERLKNTKMIDIEPKMLAMLDIISQNVSDYEFTLQYVITGLLNKSTNVFRDVLGYSELVKQPEFEDKNKLSKIIEFLEDSTVWNALTFKKDINKSSTITLGTEYDLPDVALFKTDILAGNTTKGICLIGPSRSDFNQTKGILEFIKKNIEKNFNK